MPWRRLYRVRAVRGYDGNVGVLVLRYRKWPYGNQQLLQDGTWLTVQEYDVLEPLHPPVEVDYV
jgi:hypothetical protein